MHYYISEGVVPQKEMPILFDGKKLSLNWKVQYSKYLSDYGFEQKEDFKGHYEKDINAYNRVLKRFWDGAKMTDDNKKKLRAMVNEGVDLPKEIMAVLKPEKKVVKTKNVKMTNEDNQEVDVEIPVTKKASALDRLKEL